MRVFHPHRDSDAARERVVRDTQRAELHAQRIERSADALIARVERNHITESVEAILRRAR
jgi:hypothetical protein